MAEYRDELIDESSDEIALRPLLQTLWRYRRAMFLAFIVVMLGFAAAMLVLYSVLPGEVLASVGFQLTFEGAEQDKYPNGSKFNSAEIVATPVLVEVFKANDLSRYATFQDFKESMFVLQANRDIELLSYEYQAKLGDPKLTPVDRAKLEEEFRAKRASIRSAEYSLNMRRSERLIKIPTELRSKILTDTLSTWARQAAERKGALRYDIPVVSKNALQKELIESEDYIVAVDILRTKIERILKTLIDMEQIPGALAVRLGPEQISLADLVANFQDLKRFKVEPLIGVIQASGLSRNATRMDQYFGGRLLDVRLAQTETSQRLKALQDALKDYDQSTGGAPTIVGGGRAPEVAPQLTESFIDKLVELSTKSIDIAYRQELTRRIIAEGISLAELDRQVEYYGVMQRTFASARGAHDATVANDVTRRTNQAYDEVAKQMVQVQSMFALISEQNLNPDTSIYSLITPFSVRTTSPLSARTTLLYTLVMLLVAILVIPLACLAHNYFRHWISPRTPARTTPSGHAAGV